MVDVPRDEVGAQPRRERTAIVHEGLRALIERESVRRLALLGGSEPQVEAAPRRRMSSG